MNKKKDRQYNHKKEGDTTMTKKKDRHYNDQKGQTLQ
jgi:hypothetical protein